MRTAGTHLLRSLRAEAVRTSGRGWLWSLVMPVAIALPLIITFVIAYVAEIFAQIPGQQYVQQVATTNSSYWVITITVVMTAIAAAYGHAHEFQRGAAEYVQFALPRRWTAFVGKWLFYGAFGAAASLIAVIATLLALPLISNTVYGQIAISDPAALRLLWTVPVYAFGAAGFGVGLGALVRTPAAAVGIVLFWVYVMETAVGYLPGGYSAQRFMPFLNGVYATGQDIVLSPPWGPGLALAYACVVFILVFLCGLWSASEKKVIKR